MKMRNLAVVPALFLMVACGGSAPEPETPAGEAAATEAAPAEKTDEAKPAEGAAEGEKPAEGAAAPAAEEKK